MSDFPIVMVGVTTPVTLYRGCHGREMSHLIDAMRSNYELGIAPHPAARRAIALFMAVSMFEDVDVVRRNAQRRPDRIGTHLATVELRPGLGICRADTASRGHWSIWGLPGQLAECVVDVIPIDL